MCPRSASSPGRAQVARRPAPGDGATGWPPGGAPSREEDIAPLGQLRRDFSRGLILDSKDP